MDSGSLRLTFEIGSIVAGKYRIDRHLAEGGMGVVVAATHLHLEQLVALKFLRGDVSAELDALARFTREAKAAAHLRSEHVAHVIDAGVTEDGTPYMAMEYLEGQSLARTLQTLGRLDAASAVEYVIQACEGLAEAHSHAIVHRDIKPDNLFLVERGGWKAIKILDFGISKVAFSDGGNVATGIILGSPCYMSPEQLRSTATVDHRTDLWSLGATLYELLVGRAAFDASQTLPELVTAILEKPAPRVRDARAEVPPQLDAVIDRCLAKDREARFKSAGELAAALLPFAAPRSRVPAERSASMPPAFWVDPEAGPSDRSPSPGAPQSSVPGSVAGEKPGPSGQLATSLALTVRADEIEDAKTLARRSRSTARRGLLIAGAGAVATLALVIGLGIRDKEDKPPAGAQAITPPAGTARSEAPPAAPLAPVPTESERVGLIVRTTPPSAQITIDDKPVENPFLAFYRKDGSTHRIVARAWGYEPKSRNVTITGDMVVDLGLDRVSTTAPAVAPAAPPRAPKRTAETLSPADAAIKPIAVSVGQDIAAAGGRAPLHPIETKDPYGAP
jgi:serine/threonine-protein kinase